MKEKVTNFFKGNFTYEIPELTLSETEINLSVSAGNIYNGYFTITNSKNTLVKGILASSTPLLQLKTKEFSSVMTRVDFIYDGSNVGISNLESNTVLNEYIKVISDCGEYIINVNIKIVRPYFDSKIGKIIDLTSFAYLARYNWAQAVDIFVSENFPSYILSNDEKFAFIRKDLLKSKSKNHALEEFLVAINQKLPIKLSLYKNDLSYDIEDEAIADQVLISMETWGYVDIHLSSDSPFISLEKEYITSDAFIGNSYFLKFMILPSKMHKGNNYGRIYLETTTGTLTIDIKASISANKINKEDAVKRARFKTKKVNLTKDYIDYYLGKTSKEEYISSVNEVLSNFKTKANPKLDSEETEFANVLIMHLAILYEDEERALKLIEKIKTKSRQWEKENSSLYGLFMIVQAFYSNKTEKEDKDILRETEEHFYSGVISPFLYCKGLEILNKNPDLLRKLGQFEIQVINFGIKINNISKELENQFVYLSTKEKKYKQLVFKTLTEIYKKTESIDVLNGICRLLIKGNKGTNDYFKWYKLGVLANLRIAELYEYFMLSIDEGEEQTLPQNLLYYFSYSKTLNVQKKSYLYAYLIKHKNEIPDIYKSYLLKIEKFADQQLKLGSINSHLAIIYQELFLKNDSFVDHRKGLWNVMFRYDIQCDNPNIKGVLVAQREVEKEAYLPLNKGYVQIELYNKGSIFFVDIEDNLHLSEINYSKNRLMKLDEDTIRGLPANKGSLAYLLYTLKNIIKDSEYDKNSVEILKRILQYSDLSKECYEKVVMLLIDYYNKLNSNEVDNYLTMLDYIPDWYKDKYKLIELVIDRKFYTKAFREVKKFGFREINEDKLYELCTNILKSDVSESEADDNKNSDTLIALSYGCFSKGQYNLHILKYLVEHFHGNCMELYKLWESALKYNIDTKDLEEKLLSQIIFTDNKEVDSFKVYKYFTRTGIRTMLSKAFLNYQAYEYLVREVSINTEFFKSMDLLVKTEKNDYCILSLLKYYSSKESLNQDQIKFVYRFLDEYIKRGIILPFFKKFKEHLTVSDDFIHKTFVEIKTEVNSKVTISYRVNDDKKSAKDSRYTTEVMTHCIGGIFTKSFIIFYNEKLEYSITVEKPDGSTFTTEKMILELGQDMELNEENLYNQINLMGLAKDTKDDKTFIDCYNLINKSDYILTKVFKPL